MSSETKVLHCILFRYEPNTQNVYLCPYGGNRVPVLNVSANTSSFILLYPGGYWTGMAYAPVSRKLYAAPEQARGRVLVIHPLENLATYIESVVGSYTGITYNPISFMLYCSPAGDAAPLGRIRPYVLIIDPQTDNINETQITGVTGADGFSIEYCPVTGNNYATPYNADNVLVIGTVANSADVACVRETCSANCNGACGWSTPAQACVTGETTSPTEIAQRLGTCPPLPPPSFSPTSFPTMQPSLAPTVAPIASPTFVPTGPPTMAPTSAPTLATIMTPTSTLTSAPTDLPTLAQTHTPTAAPTSPPPTNMRPVPAPTTSAPGSASAPTIVSTTHPSNVVLMAAPTSSPMQGSVSQGAALNLWVWVSLIFIALLLGLLIGKSRRSKNHNAGRSAGAVAFVNPIYGVPMTTAVDSSGSDVVVCAAGNISPSNATTATNGRGVENPLYDAGTSNDIGGSASDYGLATPFAGARPADVRHVATSVYGV